MKTLRALGAAIAFVVLASGTVRAQCTGETEQGRRLVIELATQYGSSGTRPGGVPVVDASQVRLLTSPSDAAACQQLFHAWMGQRQDPETAPTDRQWTYYQVGNMYYVVVTRISPPVQKNADGTMRIRLGWTPILVFDHDFRHVVTVGR
jgi:hypothetical protein